MHKYKLQIYKFYCIRSYTMYHIRARPPAQVQLDRTLPPPLRTLTSAASPTSVSAPQPDSLRLSSSPAAAAGPSASAAATSSVTASPPHSTTCCSDPQRLATSSSPAVLTQLQPERSREESCVQWRARAPRPPAGPRSAPAAAAQSSCPARDRSCSRQETTVAAGRFVSDELDSSYSSDH